MTLNDMIQWRTPHASSPVGVEPEDLQQNEFGHRMYRKSDNGNQTLDTQLQAKILAKNLLTSGHPDPETPKDGESSSSDGPSSPPRWPEEQALEETWPTPAGQTGQGGASGLGGGSGNRKKTKDLGVEVRRLNPRFVAWLMGWPSPDDIYSDSTGTASSRFKRRMHSAFSQLVSW